MRLRWSYDVLATGREGSSTDVKTNLSMIIEHRKAHEEAMEPSGCGE